MGHALLAASAIALTLPAGQLAAQEAPEHNVNPLKANPRIVEAWKDLRFGMFLCWGPVSLTGK